MSTCNQFDLPNLTYFSLGYTSFAKTTSLTLISISILFGSHPTDVPNNEDCEYFILEEDERDEYRDSDDSEDSNDSYQMGLDDDLTFSLLTSASIKADKRMLLCPLLDRITIF